MAAITICSDFGAPPKIKSATVSTVSPSICHEVIGPNRLRGATPRLRSGAVAGRSYPTLKVRKGNGEEIPLVQGKDQRLRFAGAAMKRYPTPRVRETQVRW